MKSEKGKERRGGGTGTLLQWEKKNRGLGRGRLAKRRGRKGKFVVRTLPAKTVREGMAKERRKVIRGTAWGRKN